MSRQAKKSRQFPNLLKRRRFGALLDLLRVAYRSVAPLVVVPAQDLLGLGSEARLNELGFAMGNWKWRLTRDQLDRLERESSSYLAGSSEPKTGRLALSSEMD